MKIEQENEVVRERTIFRIALIALGIGGAAILWVSFLLARYSAELRPSGSYPEKRLPAPTEVNHVEQSLFEGARSGGEIAAQQRDRLSRYGWVDRQEGIVHVPIERGMELYLARQPP